MLYRRALDRNTVFVSAGPGPDRPGAGIVHARIAEVFAAAL